jgi:hypothetical protein
MGIHEIGLSLSSLVLSCSLFFLLQLFCLVCFPGLFGRVCDVLTGCLYVWFSCCFAPCKVLAELHASSLK